MFKKNSRVVTEHGTGTIKDNGEQFGKHKRFLVKLDFTDTLDGDLLAMHENYDGLYYFEVEFRPLTKEVQS